MPLHFCTGDLNAVDPCAHRCTYMRTHAHAYAFTNKNMYARTQITVAVGGQGGSGNAVTRSPSRSRFRPMALQGPSSDFTRGTLGSSATLLLELKMLADVGLVVGDGGVHGSGACGCALWRC